MRKVVVMYVLLFTYFQASYLNTDLDILTGKCTELNYISMKSVQHFHFLSIYRLSHRKQDNNKSHCTCSISKNLMSKVH